MLERRSADVARLYAEPAQPDVILPGAGGNSINLFTIEENTCVGCNMCSLVCPVDNCITMREVDTGLAPMSWNQYQARLARGEVLPIEPPQHA